MKKWVIIMTFFELQQLLKRYGTIIYTGDRLGDIELMEDELKELHKMGMIEDTLFRDGKLLLLKEKRLWEK
ncbi:YqgQ family protein [Evansella vedderi]|nr:YqgQ family protein [Evansella vedderi]